MARSVQQVDDRLTAEINTRAAQLKGVTGSVLRDRISALEADVLAIKAAMAAAQGGGTPGSGGGGGSPVPTPPDPTPPAAGAPALPAIVGSTVTVSSILALKQKIADNSVGKVILQAGSYAAADPGALADNSLWIGAARGGQPEMASRTNWITVDCSAATFTGHGIKFMEGARLIDWTGLKFRSLSISLEGIVKIGGDASYVPAHDIRLRDIDIDSSCVGLDNGAQAIYFAHALGRGPHEIDVVSPRLNLTGGLYAAIQGYHSAAGAPCADHVRVYDAQSTGGKIGVIVWDPTVHDWYVELVATGLANNRLSYNWNLHGAEQAPTGGPPSNMDISDHVTSVSPTRGDYIPDATGLV